MAKAVQSRPDTTAQVLAAIDVGTNAVRLRLARPLPDGSLETLHEERDPVRPGEGVFKSGTISREVADRLLSTLRRYGALCRRHQARVRAIATSAIREAKNRDEILRRARREAGLDLEVVSGKEEARLICLGVLHGKPADVRSLVIDIGGGSTEVASAIGERPAALWSVALGAVRLGELFDATGQVNDKSLSLMRDYAREAIEESLPRHAKGSPRTALGSSGTIQAVVSFAAARGTAHATTRQLTRTVESLVEMTPVQRREIFDPRRADIIVPGAVILEAVAKHLGLKSVTAVDRGLRDGILADLLRRTQPEDEDASLTEAAVSLGRRFAFDEHHARQTCEFALALFDGFAELHHLPASARSLLEVAALLHDIGHAVSYQRHHKHTYYLVQNGDIPGLADHQRDLAARVARYHRGSPPESGHSGLDGLNRSEENLVRKLAVLLRIADSLDRSHHQPVERLSLRSKGSSATVVLHGRGPMDLELWDAAREAGLFRKIYGRRLVLLASRR